MKNIVIKDPTALAWMDETTRLDKVQGSVQKNTADISLIDYACAESTLRQFLSGETPYKKLIHGGFFDHTAGGKFFNDHMLPYLGNPRWYTAFYVPSGFLGWHEDDNNMKGHCIMFSYSELGQGCFKYFDRDIDQVVELQDHPGWMVRTLYFGRPDPKDAWWHCVSTTGPRWTWLYVWDTPEQLQSAINKLT